MGDPLEVGVDVEVLEGEGRVLERPVEDKDAEEVKEDADEVSVGEKCEDEEVELEFCGEKDLEAWKGDSDCGLVEIFVDWSAMSFLGLGSVEEAFSWLVVVVVVVEEEAEELLLEEVAEPGG